jgi:hypothetical protein
MSKRFIDTTFEHFTAVSCAVLLILLTIGFPAGLSGGAVTGASMPGTNLVEPGTDSGGSCSLDADAYAYLLSLARGRYSLSGFSQSSGSGSINSSELINNLFNFLKMLALQCPELARQWMEILRNMLSSGSISASGTDALPAAALPASQYCREQQQQVLTYLQMLAPTKYAPTSTEVNAVLLNQQPSATLVDDSFNAFLMFATTCESDAKRLTNYLLYVKRYVAPQDDPDSDGYSIAQELELGTDPFLAD